MGKSLVGRAGLLIRAANLTAAAYEFESNASAFA
jgi:hypothetical protein